MKNKKGMMWGLTKAVMAAGAILVFSLLLSYHSGLREVATQGSCAQEAKHVAGLIDSCARYEFCRIEYPSPEGLSGEEYSVSIREGEIAVEFKEVSCKAGLIATVGSDFSYTGGDVITIEKDIDSVVVF